MVVTNTVGPMVHCAQTNQTWGAKLFATLKSIVETVIDEGALI
jgi:hypothetical protein